MRALAQTGITYRASAGTECASIQLTEETDARLCIGEAEAGAGLVRRVAGVEVMVGSGGLVVSTVQVKVAAALWLPAASCALTENV